MPKKTKETFKRYNLTLSESTRARLDEIKQRTGAASDSEVVRRAIRMYEGLVTGKLVIKDGNLIVKAETLF